VSEEHTEKVKALHAVLFVADEPCDVNLLASVLQVSDEQVMELVEQLSERLEDTGLQIVRLAGGFQLATRPRYADYVQRLREPTPERLSRQALETLAIIAYRQPITRPEIDQVRGVDSSGVINSLLEKGLIAITGRKQAPGRPFLLATTPQFLSTFGLHDLSELPNLPEAERTTAGALGAPVRGLQLEETEAEEAQPPSASDEEQ